ncbi:hypothetical protein BGY98DRAFT_1035558 [Russula aff. rugulosa BPL654]|nr:hypothetical protein BGY98DRAFT_1035558 [Russula aff. rugulosa BPL654]
MSVELAFSRTLSPKQRRIVHLVAQKLGVYHYPVRKGDDEKQLGNHRGLQRVSSYLWRRHHCITLRLTLLALTGGHATVYACTPHTQRLYTLLGHVRTALHCLA